MSTVKMSYEYEDGSGVSLIEKQEEDLTLYEMIDIFKNLLNGLGYSRNRVDTIHYDEWLHDETPFNDEEVLVTTIDGKVKMAKYHDGDFYIDGKQASVRSWIMFPDPEGR